MCQATKTPSQDCGTTALTSRVSRLIKCPARIKGTHHYSFRPGEWAVITGVVNVTPEGLSQRPAFECEYEDGCVDYIAISEKAHYEIGV